jgi:pSer/pThr/pTyr-binding forkhead associated (FHA) protein
LGHGWYRARVDLGAQIAERFFRALAGLSRDEFRELLRGLHVIASYPSAEADAEGMTAFHTAERRSPFLPADEETHHQLILPVAKRGSNAFGMMITMGRASNNDLVVPCSRVSKFHAYLRQEASGAWMLHDAGATNGTSVDGKLLEPRASVAIVPGTHIELGGSALLEVVDEEGLFVRAQEWLSSH